MPASTPPFVAHLVRACWSATPEERPPFSEIAQVFASRLGVESPPTLRKTTVGIRLVEIKKASEKLLNLDKVKDYGDYKLKKGTGTAVHDKLVALKQELKEKKKRGTEVTASAAGDSKVKS